MTFNYIIKKICTPSSRAMLAQSAEHQTFNLRVKGLSPLHGFMFSMQNPKIKKK